MSVSRLIYYSENQIDPARGSAIRQLSSILSASNRNNKPLGLTGALVFDDQWFLQVLEGPHAKVWQTYGRICDDERHSGVVIAELVEAPRIFGNWWMGLATRNAKTEELFAPYLHAGRLDPRRLSAAEMLALTVSLARAGLDRELAATQAA